MTDAIFRASASSTTDTVTIPAGYADGDLEIVFITQASGNTPTQGRFTYPDGWTSLDAVIGGGDGGYKYGCAYRYRPTGDTATSVRVGNVNSNRTVGFVSYTGDKSIAYAYATTGGGAHTSATAPALTAALGGVPVRLYWLPTNNTVSVSGTSRLNASDTFTRIAASDDTAVAAGDSTGTGTLTVTSGTAGDIGAMTLVLASNSRPNTASWVSPTDNTIVDQAQSLDIVYSATDPDPGDSQKARKRRASTDSGSTWTETTETTSSQTITIAGGTYTNQDVQFQVMISDQEDAWALNWSPSLHVSFRAKPSAPTITNLTTSDTIASSSQAVDLTVDAGASAVQYAVYGDDGSGNADTSNVIDPLTASASLSTFTITGLSNATVIHIQAQQKVNGLWSDPVDLKIPVSYTPPVTPTVTLTEDPGQKRIVVTLATAAPGAGESTAVSASIASRRVADQGSDWSRSGADVALNGDTVYALPASDTDYEFQVTTYAASGATAVTSWIGSATGTANDTAPLLDGGTAANPEGVLL